MPPILPPPSPPLPSSALFPALHFSSVAILAPWPAVSSSHSIYHLIYRSFAFGTCARWHRIPVGLSSFPQIFGISNPLGTGAPSRGPSGPVASWHRIPVGLSLSRRRLGSVTLWVLVPRLAVPGTCSQLAQGPRFLGSWCSRFSRTWH